MPGNSQKVMRYLSVADILGDSGAGSVSAAGSGLSLAERPSHLTHENWVLHNSLTVLEDPEVATRREERVACS